MDYVNLGRCGLKVSRLSLGAMGFGDPGWRSWVLDETAARPVIRCALDHGINLIDTCNFYSLGESERLLGRLLRDFIPRDEVLVATKFGAPMGPGPNQRGYSRKNVMAAVDASLERLGLDHIDLYQTHIWDPDANIDELIDALDDVVRAGKVRYVGAADMPAWQFVKAVLTAKHLGRAQFVSMQNHYNLVWREDERDLIPFCRSEGIGMIPYSPSARGFLSGTSRRVGGGRTERARTDHYAGQWYGRAADEAVAAAVEAIAHSRGVSPSQVAIAWVLGNPAVHSPIIGATSAEQVSDAVGALALTLEPDEQARLSSAYQPRPYTPHA